MSYEYDTSDTTVTTIGDVPEDAVLEMLFEGTAASGEPAADFEFGHIEESIDSVRDEGFEFGVIDILSVEMRERDDDHVVFRVRMGDVRRGSEDERTDVTAPAGEPSDDVRVLHEQEIPYKTYQVAVVN